jgi:glutamate-1-semialdehyde 2,1-aminomutase
MWKQLGDSVGLTVTTGGLPALANFTVVGLDPLAVKTYITSRMLDQGYLSGNSLYVSIAHTDSILDQYYQALAVVFAELATMDDTGLAAALPHGTAQAGFKRLT